MFFLFYFIIYITLAIVDSLIGTMFLALIFALAMLVPSISIAARRLHDTGRSGWWQLISLIPLIGAIVLIVFLGEVRFSMLFSWPEETGYIIYRLFSRLSKKTWRASNV